VTDAETATYVSTASQIIGDLGAVHYFIPETLAVGRQHGLDGFRFYFFGRGGALGDVEPAVVGSAFGYFHPGLVTKIWNTARERADVGPREAGRLHLQCAADVGRREFGDIEGLDAFCAAAEKVVAAGERAGLALFTAVAAEPLPTDAPGRAMHLVTVLREFRGSAHIVAVVAVGLDPKVAHGVRRPDFWGFFGYDEADLPADTPAIRALMAESDAMTDRLVTPAYSVLDAIERQAFLDGLQAMKARHAAVSAS
jgi:hypothetical protein